MLMTRQDALFLLRAWSRSKGLLLAIVCLTAIGVGSLATVFSLVDRLFFQPFPHVGKTEEIVRLYGVRDQAPDRLGFLAYADYVDFSHESRWFSGLASFTSISLNIVSVDRSLKVDGLLVSDNYFETLGVKAVMGRALMPGQGVEPQVVLTDGIWKRFFGGDPSIVGSSLRINGAPCVVSGVAPPGFYGISLRYRPEVFLNLSAYRQVASRLLANYSGTDRQGRWLEVVGRLAPGVNLPTAQKGLDVVASRLEAEYSETNRGRSVRALPLSRVAFGPAAYETVERYAGVFVILALLLLLISLFNVASLLVVRGAGRRRELALRVALGAGRARLVLFMLVENALLGLLGGLGGFMFAYTVLPLVEKLTLPGRLILHADAKLSLVLGFAIVMALGSMVLFGLWPALRSVRMSLVPELSSTVTPRRIGGSDALIVVQLALTLAVLVPSGLLLKTLLRLEGIDSGYSADNVLVASMELDRHAYREAGVTDFYRRVVDRLDSLPGVRNAGLVAALPLLGAENLVDAPVFVDGVEQQGTVRYVLVGGDFFSAVGLDVVLGRGFAATDTASGPCVLILNEALAGKYWPRSSPLGRRVRLMEEADACEVVGVVRNSKHLNIKESNVPVVYLWYGQQESSFVGSILAPAMNLVLKTSGDPLALAPEVWRTLREMDPNVPLSNVNTLRRRLSSGISLERQSVGIFAFLGGVAMILSWIGLQGRLAQYFALRTHEMGVRMACGAGPWQIGRRVVARGLALSGGGILIGAPLARLATRWITDRLYGVDAQDLGVYLGAVTAVMATALMISLGSARQALRTDIVATLREW